MPSLHSLDSRFLTRLEALRLSVRWVKWGSHVGGRYAISRRGSSIEFADYAPYTLGDDIRAIDWNLYARHDRLFIKTYREEIELAVEILVDTTASMALPGAQKFERACELALCLAYVGLAGRHHVRLNAIAPRVGFATSWSTQRAEVGRMTDWLRRLVPRGQVIFSDWVRTQISALRIRGGQAILVSDCMIPPAEFFRGLTLLRGKHVELKVLQVLTPDELEPTRLVRSGVVVDSESGLTHELAYSPKELAQAVLNHNEQLARFCARHGIPFAQYRVGDPLEAFVMKVLPARGFLE